MNGQEMVYEFQELLSATSKVFVVKERPETHEILEFINIAIDRYIKERFLIEGSFTEKTNLLQASVNDIGSLLTNYYDETPTLTAVDYLTGAYHIDLPADYLAYIRSDSFVSKASLFTSNAWTPNLEVNYNDLRKLSTTPSNKPILLKPLVTVRGYVKNTIDDPGLIIMVDYLTSPPTKIQITYMKQPTPVGFSETSYCQLGEHLHEEIVKIAVELYLTGYKLRLAQTPNKDE